MCLPIETKNNSARRAAHGVRDWEFIGGGGGLGGHLGYIAWWVQLTLILCSPA